jgi:hypothetical protein
MLEHYFTTTRRIEITVEEETLAGSLRRVFNQFMNNVKISIGENHLKRIEFKHINCCISSYYAH